MTSSTKGEPRVIEHDDAVKASTMLKTWALDEGLKRRVLAEPALRAAAAHIARRYIAGETVMDVLTTANASVARGHAVTIDYVGESIRDIERANADAQAFVDLATAIAVEGVPGTVSLDLSHVGSLIDPQLAVDNALRIAAALPPGGAQLVISAEGSARTDLVLDLYERLTGEGARVAITLQVALHRTPDDVDRVMRLPGAVRLVKGAFLEPDELALQRDDPALITRYVELAHRVVGGGHAVSLATHDAHLIDLLIERDGVGLRDESVEFEMLHGLGTDLLDQLHGQGFATREYLIFGSDWWLYVLNRIAEHPERAIQALADLAVPDAD